MYLFIYILIIAATLAISTKKPAVAFSFMLCTFGFEQWLQSRDVFFIANTSIVNVMSGVVVLYALIITVVKEKSFLYNYPMEAVLAVVLYVYAGTSILWSPVPDISATNFFQLLPYILLMTVLAPLLIKNKEDFYDAMLFLVFFGGAISVLLLFFTEWGNRTIVLAVVTLKDKTNPLAIANLAGYVMLAAVLLNIKNEFKVWTIIRLVLVVISLAIAVKTGSRGQFILMLVVSLLLLPISRQLNQIRRFIPLLITIAFTLVVAYWAMSEFIGEDTRWDTDKMGDDIGDRYAAASRLIEQWYSSPGNLIFGLGSSASYDPSIFGFYTHIVPLEIIGELGGIGFIIYAIILYLTFSNTLISIRKIGDNVLEKGVLATVVAMVLFEFLLSFKQGSFLGSQIFFGLIIVLARFNYSIRNKVSVDDNAGDIVKPEITVPDKTSGVRLR